MSRSQRQPPPWWYGDGAPPLAAKLLSGLYAGVTRVRRALYRRGLLRRIGVRAPVLVVGNLIAGGSGKTPLTIALAQRLREEGWSPGIATRGYGRSEPSAALWVEADTPPSQGGDEPVLLARRTGVPVRADRDRANPAAARWRARHSDASSGDGLW